MGGDRGGRPRSSAGWSATVKRRMKAFTTPWPMLPAMVRSVPRTASRGIWCSCAMRASTCSIWAFRRTSSSCVSISSPWARRLERGKPFHSSQLLYSAGGFVTACFRPTACSKVGTTSKPYLCTRFIFL